MGTDQIKRGHESSVHQDQAATSKPAAQQQKQAAQTMPGNNHDGSKSDDGRGDSGLKGSAG